MTERPDPAKVAPDYARGLVEMTRFVRAGPLEPRTAELVRVRVSQINGCAYCLSIHVPRARRHGATPEQLDTLAGWRESTAFSARERAALDWAEAVARLDDDHVGDGVWTRARSVFSDREMVDLTLVVVEIGSWNRIEIAFRRPPEFESTPRAAPTPPASVGVPPSG